MNLSKQDIDYYSSLKKVAVDTLNPGIASLYKYISGPVSIQSINILQGNDNSFTQLSNPGNAFLKINNHLVKLNNIMENELVLRINKIINESESTIQITFNDLLFYKKIVLEVDFVNDNQLNQLNIQLPIFIENEQLTKEAIDFLSTYRQKYQLEILPKNYLFSHIQIYSNSNTNINIIRYDNEEVSRVNKQNIYITNNSKINNYYLESADSKQLLLSPNQNIINEGEKFIIYQNIPLDNMIIGNSNGLFYSKDECTFLAYKSENVSKYILDHYNKIFSFVVHHNHFYNKLKILMEDKTYPKGQVYPKYVFKLFNGSYVFGYDDFEHRNQAMELLEHSTYIEFNLPIRENLVTLKFENQGTKSIKVNYNMLKIISEIDNIVNITMNLDNIWITIEDCYLNKFIDTLNNLSLSYTSHSSKVELSYLTKYTKNNLMLNLENKQYMLLGNNSELILA